MQDFGATHLNAALASEAQAKAEIDILKIAKETFVESPGFMECGVRVQGGCGAR